MIIDAPIGRNPKRRETMTVLKEGGREAVTEIEVLKSHQGISLVEARPVTGRTHQIRVHLKSIQAPIVGDKIYGGAKKDDGMLCLHAKRIAFKHPTKNEEITIEAPVAKHIEQFLKILD